MALHKNFNIIPDTSGQGHWIQFDEIVSFLRKHTTPTDIAIRKENIRLVFQKNNGLNIISGRECVGAFAFTKYIFNNSGKIKVCNDLATEIFFNDLSQARHRESAGIFFNSTVLTLYQKIAQQKIKHVHYPLLISSNEKLVTDTLVEHYKDSFSTDEWDQICIFEHHFSKSHQAFLQCEDLELEKVIEEKKKFLETCLQLHQIVTKSLPLFQENIRQRQLRKKASSNEKALELVTRGQHHTYFKIDVDLKSACYNDINHIICCETVENKVEVYVELAETIEKSLLQLLGQRICHLLSSNHNILLSQVHFFKVGSFENFQSGTGVFARFTLRDNVILGHMQQNLIGIWCPSNEEKHYLDHNEILSESCDSCCSYNEPIPLAMTSFNVFEEWIFDVPLSMQIILENFINQRTSQKYTPAYMTSQLQKMYLTYDILLNIMNYKYIGILQEVNSLDLLMHFNSIGSVFEITSRAGITSSLKTAESQLKHNMLGDSRYYETFIKPHPLKYHTLSGPVDGNVCMQQCYIIAMLDNLVRLKTKEDPSPGESRTKQICTLPITLQGLPKDASVVENWHDPLICNGLSDCLCKQSKVLSKEDIENSILQTTPEEESMKQRFNSLCTWGTKSAWVKLTQEDKHKLWNIAALAGKMCDTVADNHLTLDREDNILDVHLQLEDEEQEDGLFEEIEGVPLEDLDDLHDDLQLLNMSYEIEVRDSNINILEKSLDCLKLQDHSSDDSDEEDNGLVSDSIVAGNINCNTDNSVEMCQSISDSLNNTIDENLPKLFGLLKFEPPALLCRRPPVATGRDDDIIKLKEILDELLLKLGNYNVDKETDRILCGPDNKILANLLKLQAQDKKYNVFLPEFPLLHLRKSKITTLFSGYKDAGLLHILKYMRDDDDDKDWSKLLFLHHIDIATRYIKRLSQAMHLAFLIRFGSSLSEAESLDFWSDLNNSDILRFHDKWRGKYEKFMKKGIENNATFAVHVDMMTHCDEVIAIYFAERMGGKDGYMLLLATVKSSILFQFLNGATSYAPLCTKLLYSYSTAGEFYKGLKHTLFTTPIGNSTTNFATDTKREIEHIKVVKLLRAGSTEKAVTCRMSLIDSLEEIHDSRKQNRSDLDKDHDLLEWEFSHTDMQYIVRTAGMIIRRGALSQTEDLVPCNVYSREKHFLSPAIIDSNSASAGKYMLKKFIAKENMFGCSTADIPALEELTGPADFVRRVRVSKGVTIRRVVKSSKKSEKTEREVKEEKRKKSVQTKNKKTDCLSSDMSNCQALLKPDCSKPKVMKALGMQKALLHIFEACLPNTGSPKGILAERNIVQLEKGTLPKEISDTVTFASVEFAGVKFGNKFIKSGVEYLHKVEKFVIKPVLYSFRQLEKLVICEEKYRYTPDDFKAATRHQRSKTNINAISHLKTGEEIISDTHFDRQAIISAEGKCLIGTFLASHADRLQIKEDVVIDIDSELEIGGCECDGATAACQCQTYAIPLRCYFSKSNGFEKKVQLKDVHQRKGEAELSQVDWLIDAAQKLTPGQSAVSILTSGDIDAIPIHLFVLSYKWPRNENNKFDNNVYVVLQKSAGKNDVYNITAMIELLEAKYDDIFIAAKLALGLCLGGNDFIPKYHGKSHDSILQLMFHSSQFRDNIFKFDKIGSDLAIQVDKSVYADLIKQLYCPKGKQGDDLEFEKVRLISMYGLKGIPKSDVRNPQLWLPPRSVLDKVSDLLSLQIEYLQTVGNPNSNLPCFLEKGCLTKSPSGEIEYDLGPESRVKLPEFQQEPNTQRKKRHIDSVVTPVKCITNKRPPMASTPIHAPRNNAENEMT